MKNPFKKKPKLDNVKVTSKKLKIGRKQFIVYQCGKETIVYQGDKEVYNSVTTKESFDAWKKKQKKFKLFNRKNK